MEITGSLCVCARVHVRVRARERERACIIDVLKWPHTLLSKRQNRALD